MVADKVHSTVVLAVEITDHLISAEQDEEEAESCEPTASPMYDDHDDANNLPQQQAAASNDAAQSSLAGLLVPSAESLAAGGVFI
jgi:hypothetical protein